MSNCSKIYIAHLRKSSVASRCCHLMNINNCQGDGNPHSKKDAKLRYAELFAYVRKPFCKYFAANMEALLYEQQASLLILDIFEAPSTFQIFKVFVFFPHLCSGAHQKSWCEIQFLKILTASNALAVLSITSWPIQIWHEFIGSWLNS